MTATLHQSLLDEHWEMLRKRTVLLTVDENGKYVATHALTGASVTGRSPRMAIEAL